jgi:hypothetical protein
MKDRLFRVVSASLLLRYRQAACGGRAMRINAAASGSRSKRHNISISGCG